MKESTLQISVTCHICKAVKTITVPFTGWQKWQRGALIQSAMPDVPREERELLISKTCGECWTKLFGS